MTRCNPSLRCFSVAILLVTYIHSVANNNVDCEILKENDIGMSDTIITIQHDNKDVEKSNIPEPASPDTALHMHAAEDEEKDVCGGVLHKKEESKTGRSEQDVEVAIEKTVQDGVLFAPKKEYIVCYDFGRQGQFQNSLGSYNHRPNSHQSPGQQPPTPYRQKLLVYSYGDGDALDYSDGNEDRNSFVRKVTIILLIGLIVTAAFVTTAVCVPSVKHFFRVLGLPIVIASGIGLVAMSYVMPCLQCARRPPMNYICFIFVVMLQCLFCSAITVRYRTHIILWALFTTVIIVFICVILACTSFDFTKWLIYVIVISVALCALSLIIFVSRVAFGVYSKPLHIAITFGLTLVSIVTLIIDLQMVLGGKSIELTEDDYVLGAYMLYMCIIDIFLKLLSLINLIDS